jgi:cysteine desulfurase
VHYLDHAATTPLRASAREAWLAVVDEGPDAANPSSVHAAGRRARSIVDDSRERVAAALGAHPTEVIFTSGATEANNFALASARGPIVTTAVEHHSVLDTAKAHGAIVLGVESRGVVDVEAIQRELPRTGLLSVQLVNNETGTIQPLGEILAIAKAAHVPVHSDAVQAVGHLHVNFGESGVAMMSVSAHKVGGPVGVGALLAKRDVSLSPLVHGGGQQRGRSGTLDAAGTAAFAAALEEAVIELETENARLSGLRGQIAAGIAAAVPDVNVMGGENVAPHILNAVFPGASAEALIFGLDQRGIAVSSGSACTAGVVDASHVLLAMGRTQAEAGSALRVSVGHTSTQADVDAFLAALPAAVAGARASASR